MILGLIVIYFIGKKFYQLAEEYDKSQWGFAILGVVSYYVGQLIGGFLIGIISLVINWNIDDIDDIVISLMALPIGILTCYGLYVLLEKNWKKKKALETVSIDDIGKDNR